MHDAMTESVGIDRSQSDLQLCQGSSSSYNWQTVQQSRLAASTNRIFALARYCESNYPPIHASMYQSKDLKEDDGSDELPDLYHSILHRLLLNI